MTATVPTLTAIAGLVEALLESREALAVAMYHHGPTLRPECLGCSNAKLAIVKADVALAAWRDREPLAYDVRAVLAVSDAIEACRNDPRKWTNTDLAEAACRALDARLVKTRPEQT